MCLLALFANTGSSIAELAKADASYSETPYFLASLSTALYWPVEASCKILSFYLWERPLDHSAFSSSLAKVQVGMVGSLRDAGANLGLAIMDGPKDGGVEPMCA